MFMFSFVTQMNFFSLYSFSCCIAYSSIASTMNSTSYPFFFSFSRNGALRTASSDSPVM